MSILICAATGIEFRAIRRAVRETGKIHEVQVIRTGMGRASAAKSLDRELSRRTRMPEMVISSGFAGSLAEDVPVGAWVYAKTLASRDTGNAVVLPPPEHWNARLRLRAVDFLTADAVLTGAGWNGAVDMESSALAAVAEKHGMPFCVLRMISDSPAQPLPRFVAEWAAVLVRRDSKAKRLWAASRALKNTLMSPFGVLNLLRNGKKSAAELTRGWLSLIL